MQDGLSFSLSPPPLTVPLFPALAFLLIREEQLQPSNSHFVLSSCQRYFGAGSSLLLLSWLSPCHGAAQRGCVPGLLPLGASLGQLQEGHQELEELILLETNHIQ